MFSQIHPTTKIGEKAYMKSNLLEKRGAYDIASHNKEVLSKQKCYR